MSAMHPHPGRETLRQALQRLPDDHKARAIRVVIKALFEELAVLDGEREAAAVAYDIADHLACGDPA